MHHADDFNLQPLEDDCTLVSASGFFGLTNAKQSLGVLVLVSFRARPSFALRIGISRVLPPQLSHLLYTATP